MIVHGLGDMLRKLWHGLIGRGNRILYRFCPQGGFPCTWRQQLASGRLLLAGECVFWIELDTVQVLK